MNRDELYDKLMEKAKEDALKKVDPAMSMLKECESMEGVLRLAKNMLTDIYTTNYYSEFCREVQNEEKDKKIAFLQDTLINLVIGK